MRVDMNPDGIHRVAMVGKSEQVAIRLEPETLEAIDGLGVLLAKQMAGTTLPRSAVIRVALARGLESMTAELGGTKPKRRK